MVSSARLLTAEGLLEAAPPVSDRLNVPLLP